MARHAGVAASTVSYVLSGKRSVSEEKTMRGIRYHAGPGLDVGNLYPCEHARAFYEGMAAEGHNETVTLVRSAWSGSQRYGAALWSGDMTRHLHRIPLFPRDGAWLPVTG
jgi:alpha-glucosidase (family GH31 glycosyl hydrolase)